MDGRPEDTMSPLPVVGGGITSNDKTRTLLKTWWNSTSRCFQKLQRKAPAELVSTATSQVYVDDKWFMKIICIITANCQLSCSTNFIDKNVAKKIFLAWTQHLYLSPTCTEVKRPKQPLRLYGDCHFTPKFKTKRTHTWNISLPLIFTVPATNKIAGSSTQFAALGSNSTHCNWQI